MIARVEDKLVDFGCDFGNVLCGAVETQANWAADAINWLAEWALGSQSFRPGDDLWGAATSEAGVWLGMGIFVMMITFAVGIVSGMLLQRPNAVRSTLIATLTALPAFYFAIFITGQGLQVIDEFSDGLLTRLTGEGGFAGLIQRLFSANASWGASLVGTVTGQSPVGLMLLVLAFLGLGVLLITFAMAFRDFVLLILIAFAPLGFVLLPAKGLDDVWSKRWMSSVAAMALAKPLILGTLVLTLAAFGRIDTIWSGGGLTLSIGIVITAFMPIMAYGFFQFMGGGNGGDDVGQRAASTTTQKTQQVVSAAARRIPNGAGGSGARGAATTRRVSGGAGTSPSGAVPEAQPAPSKGKGSRPGQGPAASGVFEPSSSAPKPKTQEVKPPATPEKRPTPPTPPKVASPPKQAKPPSRPPRHEPRIPEGPQEK